MGFQLVTALEQRRFLSVSAHIRLLNNEDTIQAGQSVHVNALPTRSGGTSFGSGEAISSRFQWNFGDPGGDYNKLPGFNAAHVYDTPGTYNLRLKITNDAGESDTASRVVTVKPANRRAVYVNPWGSDRNDGSSAG